MTAGRSRLLDRIMFQGTTTGRVTSLQTFGAHGANFNSHAHHLVTEGVFADEGEFLPLPSLDTAVVMDVFRHSLLGHLHRAGRFSEDFMRNLLSRVHPCFSFFAGSSVDGAPLSTQTMLFSFDP